MVWATWPWHVVWTTYGVGNTWLNTCHDMLHGWHTAWATGSMTHGAGEGQCDRQLDSQWNRWCRLMHTMSSAVWMYNSYVLHVLFYFQRHKYMFCFPVNHRVIKYAFRNQSKPWSKLIIDWSQFRPESTGFGASTKLISTSYTQFSQRFSEFHGTFNQFWFRFVCDYVRKLDWTWL